MRRLALVLLATLLILGTVVAYGQTTGTLTLLPPSGGGGGGDITAVGDCSTGDCFQATTDATFLGAPVGGGVATFRAITESDLPATLATDLELTAAVSAHAGDAGAHHVWPLAISDLSDVSETGAAAGEALVADGSGAWAASLATVCLSDGTNCPPGGVGSASPGELLYSSSGAVDGVTGSSVSGSDVTLGGQLHLPYGAEADPSLIFPNGSGFYGTLSANAVYFSWAGVRHWNFTSKIQGRAAGSVQIRDVAASSTIPNIHPMGRDQDGIGQHGNGDIRIIADSISGLGQTATETTLYVAQVNSSFSQTCASDGTGAAGFLAVTVSGRTFVKVTNSDPHSCSASLSETGATDGQRLEVVLVSNAGGTLDFADSSGVQETGTGCSLAQWGSATFRYVTDRWALVSCVPTN